MQQHELENKALELLQRAEMSDDTVEAALLMAMAEVYIRLYMAKKP